MCSVESPASEEHITHLHNDFHRRMHWMALLQEVCRGSLAVVCRASLRMSTETKLGVGVIRIRVFWFR